MDEFYLLGSYCPVCYEATLGRTRMVRRTLYATSYQSVMMFDLK